ncbi:MAG: SDR family NAD(P)-dependent oxidoreductase [Acidobacteriia bacterium]|nr:SDR family NAD(P)-dependent oxidoreductase [Methyloceanibacter sp.]MBX5472691.1 SDR family NAD(P)-dependent oxidoreductase [Acetobacteraceae bacterium]MCL6490820.1 SDR family NAD(P)-dependent oxidoreductase [Terriglobia bacterium]
MSLPLEGRVALVTGASRGLGAATAIELARLGAQVIITARTEGGLAETDDAIRARGLKGAVLLPLDLKEGDKLDALGPSIYQRFHRLDIFVSNAATLGRLTPAPHILPMDWAEVMAVNLGAAWRLIRSLGPLVQIAEAGRAVFVTCRQGRTPQAYWGAYGASKAGIENLALSWAEEVRGSRLRVNLFDPGPMATRLRATAMPGEDPATLHRPAEVAPALVELCLPDERRHGSLVSFNG